MVESKLEINSAGERLWWKNLDFHREDGPAIECANGDKRWLVNGKYHRTDGPAMEFANGERYYY